MFIIIIILVIRINNWFCVVIFSFICVVDVNQTMQYTLCYIIIMHNRKSS